MDMAQKDLEEKVNDIHRAVDDIRRVVVGNVEYKQKGLIERVDDLENHNRTSDRRMIRAVTLGAGGGSLLGFGLSKLGFGKAFAIWLKLFGI